MDYVWLFGASFTIALSGALAPGPLLAVVISQSCKRGYATGPLIILGHAFAEIVMIALLVLGLSHALKQPVVVKTIAVLGSSVLIVLGAQTLLGLRTLTLQMQPETRQHAAHLPLLGLTMSFTNPYWTVWWLTIGLGMVMAAGKAGMAGVAVFFAGHILADLLWYSIVSAVIWRNKRFISLKVYKILVGICAAVLAGFGLYFGISWLL